MKRWLVCVLCLVCAGAALNAQPEKATTPNGFSIQGIVIGMSESDVKGVLGPPLIIQLTQKLQAPPSFYTSQLTYDYFGLAKIEFRMGEAQEILDAFKVTGPILERDGTRLLDTDSGLSQVQKELGKPWHSSEDGQRRLLTYIRPRNDEKGSQAIDIVLQNGRVSEITLTDM